MEYVSRAGEKLAVALEKFEVDPQGKTCADFGCSTGGFTEVLLRGGALKIYAVDTGYGVLDYKLRMNDKVEVFERTNAMHVELPERCDIITIDVSWTPQEKILPSAFLNLDDQGLIVSLVKPHYEAEERMLTKGVLEEKFLEEVLEKVEKDITKSGGEVIESMKSPISGKSGGNVEFLYLIKKAGA